MRRAFLSLLLLLGCAPWNQPQNQPLQGENAAPPATPPGDDHGNSVVHTVDGGGAPIITKEAAPGGLLTGLVCVSAGRRPAAGPRYWGAWPSSSCQ